MNKFYKLPEGWENRTYYIIMTERMNRKFFQCPIDYISRHLDKVNGALLREDIFGQKHLTVWYKDNSSQTWNIHEANWKYADKILKYCHNKFGD